MGGQPLEGVIDELSAIEQQPELSVTAGKVETEDLKAACLYANGL